MADAEKPQRKWLPWVIGIAVLVLLLFWMRGCGKEPASGVTADTTQTMMAPPAPASVDTTAGDTAHVQAGKTTPRPAPEPSPSAVAAPAPDTVPASPPANDGAGAMGGQGAPGKKAPTSPAPKP